MTQNEESLKKWRKKILEALGENGRVLTEVIPNLELLIGIQPDVPKLGSSETQNRFNYICRKLVKAISQPEHPLVIFIDDLQWADIASLSLLEVLISDPENKYLFFIGAYRNNETPLSHPIFKTFDIIQKSLRAVQVITLENLPVNHVNKLVAETLHTSLEDAWLLTELIFHKTAGNAFFIKEFLKSLFNEGLLVFDNIQAKWVWEIHKIRQLNITENVVELMAGKTQRLPEDLQSILTLASCIGNRFDIEILRIIYGSSASEAVRIIELAIQEDLVITFGENYKFSHDRIQQAFYMLLSEDERKNTHLKIGVSLVKHLPENKQNKYLFEIVNQFHFGESLVKNIPERELLPQLNLIAGRKAKSTAAYNTALNYLSDGILWLPENPWVQKYELTLSLYTEAAECCCIIGNFQWMQQLTSTVLEKATSLLDKVKAYEVIIQAEITQTKLLEATNIGLSVLKLLGMNVSKKHSKLYIIIELIKARWSILRKPVEMLSCQVTMTDPQVLASMRIFSRIASAAYIAVPDLFPLIVLKQLNLSFKHGNATESAYTYALYGIILCGVMGDPDLGYRFGKLALNMLTQNNLKAFKPKVFYVVYGLIFHWKEHFSDASSGLLEGYQSGLEIGDLEFISYPLYGYCQRLYFTGKELPYVEQQVSYYSKAIYQTKQETIYNYNQILHQVVLNLMGKSSEVYKIVGPSFDEDVKLPQYLKANDGTGLFCLYLHKAILSYLFGNYNYALTNLLHAEKHINSVRATLNVTLYYFYDSLTRIMLYPQLTDRKRRETIQRINKNLKKMKKWAHFAPMNHQHKYYLVRAEFSNIRGEVEKAAFLYEKAIQGAKENNFLNEEALAYELAGRFYLSKNVEHLSEYYLVRAHQSYEQWGAMAKVTHLESSYPQLFKRAGFKGTLGVYDLTTILKASAAISREITIDKLHRKLISIISENVGAQKGALILLRNNELVIELQGITDNQENQALKSIPLANNLLIPESIINYVYQTKSTIIINDPVKDSRFYKDSLIIKHQPKSILCSPIVNQGNLLGILYFENSLTSGTFTRSHLELLKLLSGQIAVSITNALNEEKKTSDFLEREALLKKINLQQTITSKAILQTQAEERKRIAEELHDGLGYLLSTIKLNLTALQEREHLTENHKIVANSMHLLNDSFEELRQISNNLMPDMLLQFGLVVAVQNLCEKINHSGRLTVSFNTFNINKRFNKDFEMEVYRVIQEIINNVLKHAQAKTLEIQFIHDEDKLVITAEDDGKGFDYENTLKSTKKGRGLTNILNRINYLQGNIRYDSSPNNGTIVMIELPFDNSST